MLSLVAVLINQRVLHSHVRLLFRSLNLLGRRTSDLAVLVLQTGRKTLNLDGVLLQLEALRQLVKTFRLDFLGVLLTNNTISQRSIRHHNLGNNLLLLRLRNRRLLSLLNELGRIFLIRILIHRIAILIGDTNRLFNHDLNLTGHSHLSGTSLGRSTGDLSGCLINLQTFRQALCRVLRGSAFGQVLRCILEQRRNLIGRVRIVLRAQRKLLRYNSGERIRDLPTIIRLTRSRINTDHSSGIDRGFLQILRRLEITRRDNTLVITLKLAHRVGKLFLLTVRTSSKPTDRIIRIRDQTSSLGGHLGARTTLIVVRVVLRDVEDRLRSHQRELQAVHVRTCKHRPLIPVVLEHVHRERRILHITTLNARVDVHVVGVDVTTLRRVNRTTRKRTITRSTSLSLKRLSNLAEVPLSELVGSLRSLILLRTRDTISALKRQVNRAISLRWSNYRLSDVRTFTVLSLVRLNDALLVRTLLLSRVTIIGFLPRINLTRDLIIKVRRNNLYTTSSAITLFRLVLVVARQGTGRLTGLPPHHRLVRRSDALNSAVSAIVRELTINCRLTGLAVERTGPILLRLGQPTNVIRLLLKHETTVGNAGTSRTSRKVPRLLDTLNTVRVTARLHITGHYDRVLALIRVLTPDTNLEIAVTSQVERRSTDLIRHRTSQIKREATLRVGGGVERRGNLALTRHILQVNDVALQRFIVLITRVIRTTLLIDVGITVVTAIVTPATLGENGVRHQLILTLRIGRSLSTSNSSRLFLLRERNRLRQRCNQRKRQRSRSNRRATTTCNVILLHRKFLPRK